MKGYSKYKACDISWIGEIPKHWEVKRLGSAFIENRTINSSLDVTEAYKFNYGALIRKDEDVNPAELKDTYCKYTCLNVNDIVINGLNLNYDFVSQRVAKAYAKGIITSAYLTLTPRDGINSKYYLYLLKSMDSMKLFHGMGTGIRLTLSYNEIKKQQIPFPPLSEQQHIVSFLDEKTAKIDEYIDKKNKEIEALKEWKKALIAHVVTKGLNTNAKMKDSGASWIGEIPEHWKVDKLGMHFRQRNEKVSDKEFPALSVSKEGVTPQLSTAVKTDNGDNRKKVCKGDFVVNSRSDRKGSCGFSSYNGSVSLINIVVTPIDLCDRYYHYLFRSNNYIEEFYRLGRGIVADLWTTRYVEMRNIMIPLPPIEEQQEIVEYIDAATTKADRMIVELTNHVESMKEYKQRLIADVVTGKINVQPCNTCL